MPSKNTLSPGIFIKATEDLQNTYFESAIIFITTVDETGAIGFIVNQPFPRKFNELVEFASSPSIQLFEGGPMEHEKLFILHQREDLIQKSEKISATIYYGGNFKQAVTLMNSGILKEKDFKLFIGYCGWDKDELEAEIKEGSWTIIEHYVLFPIK